MTTILYAEFLKDKRQYNLAQAFWKRLFDRFSEKYNLKFSGYINEYQSSGKKEYDGNPIFSAFFLKMNRAVRIIQGPPENDEIDISAWVDEITLKEGMPPAKELVIDMVLSKESKSIASNLIELWLADQLDPQLIDSYLSEEPLESIPV